MAAERRAHRRGGARPDGALIEFLVRIEVVLPAELDAERRAELAAAELAHGRELYRRGAIRRIWRLPGGQRNVGVWEARDGTELHALIESLPMYQWIRAEVTALATHPLEADA